MNTNTDHPDTDSTKKDEARTVVGECDFPIRIDSFSWMYSPLISYQVFVQKLVSYRKKYQRG